MEAYRTTCGQGWLNQHLPILFALLLGVGMFSCPSTKDSWAGNVDSVANLEQSSGAHRESSVGDENAGADVGLSGVMEDVRVGIQVPLDSDPMRYFFDALHDMEIHKEQKVRILHYGDSHTAADFLTTAVRRGLQTRFGDGGRGFVLLGKPWRSYRPKDIETMATGKWQSERIMIAADPATLDGYYGLAGITVETSDKFARSVVRTNPDSGFGKKAALFDLFYMVQPSGGSLRVLVDGKPKGTIETQGTRKRTGFYKVKVNQGSHEFEIRTNGDGEVRLFGAAVESENGLVYDSLGVNGGFFYTPHRWNEVELQKQIERRQPKLLVTMYGSNEAGSKTLTPQSYKKKVKTTMSRFMGGAKEASCLMIGPPDQAGANGKMVRLEWIIRVQREVAAEIGCGFIDLQEMMGGVGAHETWQQTSPRMAQTDGIHLTVKGYMYLGERIAQEIITAYDSSVENNQYAK